MYDKYLALQGIVYLDNHDIGNVPTFKIKNQKFVLKVDSFNEDHLQEVFQDRKCGKFSLDLANLTSKSRQLKFEGVNTADNNQKMIFETEVQFKGFDSLSLIDDDLTSLVLYGDILSPITVEYLPVIKLTSENLSLKTPRVEKIKERDLEKISKNLFQVISQGALVNRRNVVTIERKDADSCKLVLNSASELVIKEPLDQVAQFFRGFDNSEDNLIKKLDSKLSEMLKQQEAEKLSQYLV